MPLSNHGWPDDFGFRLGGSGPSYILSVEDGSSAHMAGLQAGDQVLEIEGQDVSALNPQALAALAQKQKNVPPSIGVVSRIQQVSPAKNTPSLLDMCLHQKHVSGMLLSQMWATRAISVLGYHANSCRELLK